MTTEIKKAEANGYSRGYTAGRKRIVLKEDEEQRRAKRQAFMDQAFVALLPSAMLAAGWTLNGKKVSTGADRVALASAWARQALSARPLV